MTNEVWQDDPPFAVGSEPGDDVTPSDDKEFARLRRNRIAEGFAFALTGSGVNYRSPHHMVREAIEAADALIAELDK